MRKLMENGNGEANSAWEKVMFLFLVWERM